MTYLAGSPQKYFRDNLLSNVNWNIETKRQTGSSVLTGNAVATSKDFRIFGTAESSWDAVRIHILSAETANSVQAVTANFAPTSTAANVPTPTGTWTTFTWSGAGSVNLADSTSNQLWTVASSDWMSSANIQSVARTDGGALPMWAITIHYPVGAGTFTYTLQQTSSAAFNTEALTNGRRLYQYFQNNVDGVGTPTAFTSSTEQGSSGAFIIQFRSRGRVLSYMANGDSIQGGSLTTSNALGPGFQTATAYSIDSLPIQYAGAGWASQTSANYLANAKTLITATQPQMASYAVYSPNDTAPSTTQNQVSMRQAIDFVQHCRANNCVPILLGPTPIMSDSLAVSNSKIALNNTLLALRSRGMLVVDYWSRIAIPINTSTGWGWNPAYCNDSTSGIHPNDVGAAIMAQAIWDDAIGLVVDANSH